MKQILTVVFLVSGLFWWTGCAVGYGIGTANLDYGPVDPDDSLIHERGAEVSTSYHELRAIDKTGLLLSGLVSTASQYQARQAAIERAYDHDGDGVVNVEYEYEPMPILPGTITDLSLRFGLGQAKAGFPDDTQIESGDVNYFAFDVRSEFYTWTLDSAPVVGSVFAAMRYENVEVSKAAPGYGLNDGYLDVSLGSALGYAINTDLLAVGRAELGVVSPLLVAVLGGDNATYINGQVQGELSWRFLDFVLVSAHATLGRWNTGQREVTESRLGANLMVSFE